MLQIEKVSKTYHSKGVDYPVFIEKWYPVLYQIQDDTVYVEYILDCRWRFLFPKSKLVNHNLPNHTRLILILCYTTFSYTISNAC